MNDPSPATLPDRATSDTLNEGPQRQKSHKRQILILGGIGGVVLLCLGLLAGSTILFVRHTLTPSPAETLASSSEGEVLTAVGEQEIQPGELTSDSRISHEPEPGSASGAPEMSPLIFALETTATGEPVEPGFSFAKGTTRLHAVFEYAHLTSTQTWTQVWYHNGSEVSSTDQPWLEATSGVYDYVIEAGGTPLPGGEWALEFYVDGELLTAGSFTIESEVEPAEESDLPDLAELPQVYFLAYPKWNGEKHDLYVGDTNGSQEQFIIGRAAGPSWSLDGRYLFFYGEEGVDQQVINGQVYPLPGTSNGVVRLTALPLPTSVAQLQLYQGHGWNDGTARYANVSPDGTMIAYDGDRGGGRRIYFLGTAANQQFRYELIGEQADWSPDSQKVVYRSGRNNQTGIWISNRTDSGHIRITGGGTDSFPTWSAAGQTIAFSRDMGGNVDIYTVKVDGSDLQRLTDTPGHDTLPAYLPNGDLVFRSARTGRWGIWKMKGDGSAQTEIIPNAPVGPDWAFSKMGVLR